LKKTLIKIVSFIVIAIFLFYGSTHREITSNLNNGKINENENNILIVGSTALQPLAERAADYFQNENPKIIINVQGGGSGAGLTQVQAGSVQIGNSDVFAEQKDGIDAKKLVDHKVAVVGFTPVVNNKIKIANLSMQQLHDIFTGKITNWKELGGNDQPIVVINRASGSGSRTVFESIVLQKGENVLKSQEQDSNGTVRRIVASTPGSISYLGFGEVYGKGIKSLTIDHTKPIASNVENNNWKIWAYEHMYTKGKAKGNVKKFIDFFLSKNVQKTILSKMGYIPLKDMEVEKNAEGIVQ
jgi:phosphate transport system substrate-binding protein